MIEVFGVGVVHANDDSKSSSSCSSSSSSSSSTSDRGKSSRAGSIDSSRQEKSRIRPAAAAAVVVVHHEHPCRIIQDDDALILLHDGHCHCHCHCHCQCPCDDDDDYDEQPPTTHSRHHFLLQTNNNALQRTTCEQSLTTTSNRSISRHTKKKERRGTRRTGKKLVLQSRRWKNRKKKKTTMSLFPFLFNRLFVVHLLLTLSILSVWLQFSQQRMTTTTTTTTTTAAAAAAATTMSRSTTSTPFLAVVAFLHQYPLRRTFVTCPSTSSPFTFTSTSTITSSSASTIPSSSTSTSSTSLNGVRGFRAWFEKQFPEATCTVDVSQKQDTFDHVLVDMNQILHVVLRKARSEGHAHKLLMMQLDDLVRSARPNHSLVLAIDGAPGAAKLATQRKRRFYILKNTQFKIDHFNKVTSYGTKDEIALLGSSKRKLERRLRAYQSELQSFELAPCTERMKGFEEAILYWAWSRLNSASYDNNGRSDRRPPLLTKQTRVYFSPSTVTGEGEIKLLEWVNNFQGMLERQNSPSVAFVGGDTDMVLEAMVVHPNWTQNVFVLRKSEVPPVVRSPYKGSNEEKGTQRDIVKKKAMLRDSLECTSIWEMTRCLDVYCRKNLPAEVYSPDILLQIRTDIVILTILNGNDYLPRVPDSDFGRNFQIYMTLMKRFMNQALNNYKKRKLSGEVGAEISMSEIGLIDPNSLNFRLKFAASFFRALGVASISPSEQMKTVQAASVRRTYSSILNDMAAIGFIPSPVQYTVMTTEDFAKESSVDKSSDLGFDPNFSTVDQDEDEDESDDFDDEDDDIEMADSEYDNDDDNDDEEERDEVTLLSISGGVQTNETEIDRNNTYVLRLTVGKRGKSTFREYCQEITGGLGPRNKFTSERNEVAKMALKDADLLQYFETGGSLTNLAPEWEIDRPVAPKTDRYLAGLVWTLQTYQDGVCPNYSYNYGKRLAPTGESIARFFDKARRNGKTVGPELIYNAGIFSGRDVSAGASCLAALPTKMKHLVPKPFSLLDDEIVEEAYGLCVDKHDNSFDLPKFQKLLEAEIKSQGLDTVSEFFNSDEKALYRDSGNGRRIILGDHFWSVLSLSKREIEHPFCPPPPPVTDGGFSLLRRNNRIKASRIISIDVSRRRNITAESGKSETDKKHYWRHLSSKTYTEVDHCSMEELFQRSQTSDLLQIPYKRGFQCEGLQAEPVISQTLSRLNVAKQEQSRPKPAPLNKNGQNAKYLLNLLEQAGLLNGYCYQESKIGGKNPTFNMTLDVTIKNYHWSGFILCRSKKLGAIHLASNALNAILSRSDDGKKKEEWHEMDTEDLKARLLMQQENTRDGWNNDAHRGSPIPSVKSTVEHLYRLKDLGLIKDCFFLESQPKGLATDAADYIELILIRGDLTNGFPPGSDELKLGRVRPLGENKKTTRRILSSMALDTLLHGKTNDEPYQIPTLWDTMPFELVKSLLGDSQRSLRQK